MYPPSGYEKDMEIICQPLDFYGHNIYQGTYVAWVKNGIEDLPFSRGYIAWSLMDNFEWQQSYSERFGHVFIDYDTLERIPKDSYYWYKNVIESNGEIPQTEPRTQPGAVF